MGSKEGPGVFLGHGVGAPCLNGVACPAPYGITAIDAELLFAPPAVICTG